MRAILGVGSNVDPDRNLARGISELARHVTVERISRAWRTPPVGMGGPPFLNAAAIVEFPHDVDALREVLRGIEDRMGRIRGPDKFADRPIDYDVLAVHRGGWVVVEPRLGGQPFHLHPLSDIVPDLMLPGGETVAAAARARPLQGAHADDGVLASPGP